MSVYETPKSKLHSVGMAADFQSYDVYLIAFDLKGVKVPVCGMGSRRYLCLFDISGNLVFWSRSVAEVEQFCFAHDLVERTIH